MRIGIFFAVRKSNGGAYQYAVTFLNVLKNNPEHQYVIFNQSPDLPEEFGNLQNFKIINFKESKRDEKQREKSSNLKSLKTKFKILSHNLLLRLRLFSLLASLTKTSQKPTLDLIKSKNIDLLIFTMTNKLAFLTDIPSIVPIHDINHKLHPEFPELSKGKTWVQREYISSQVAKKASKILVDSEVSRDDIAQHYHADPEKIVILPFLPPDYLKADVSQDETETFFKKFNLPKKFIFYPAQLWPHKNHINLVTAVGILKSKGIKITLVLTGSKKEKFGIWDELTKIMKKYNIEDQIKYLGYVEDKEIAILYESATAMTMPAFIGPTYIPIYEAWSMGCPVLCSDIKGLREQVDDAALLFNPKNPADIAEKIERIWDSENLRLELVQKGKKQLTSWTPEDFAFKLNKLIKESS